MAESFVSVAEGVASGTDKTILNLFNPAATPTCRGRVYKIFVGSDDAPADQAARFHFARTTAVGTEATGFVPNNLDPAGPAGSYDAGVGTFSVEPTYTASKQLAVISVNQRVPGWWFAMNDKDVLELAATQNNGGGLRSKASTSTQAYEATIWHEE